MSEQSWTRTNEHSVLRDRLGSHWSAYYDDNGAVEQLLVATQELDKQTCVNYDEAARLVSRSTAPVFHRENWYALTIRQSELNQQLHQYGGGTQYGSGYQYGARTNTTTYAVPVPDDLAGVPLIASGIRRPAQLWARGIDFELNDGYLQLRTNPFDDPAFPKEEVFSGGVVVDMTTTLWLCRSEWDRDYLHTHFGYVLGLDLPSSEAYKDLINVLFDALVQGTNSLHVRQFFSAITGVPLCKTDGEVVELIQEDRQHLNIITDANVYQFQPSATATVEAGDVLTVGQTMADPLTFYDLNRGIVPEGLASLTVGPECLPGDYLDGLTFHNKTVPIETTTVADKLRASFEVGGFPADVEAFWDTVHSNGVDAGQTLANHMDIRPTPATEPTADNLPSVVNPLQFLVGHLLRFNTTVVHIKAGRVGTGVGLRHSGLLAKILPPWCAVIPLVDLEVADGPANIEATGGGVSYATNAVPEENIDLSLGETAPSLRGINCYCL